MAHKGKVIDNAYTGEVLTFLDTAADTNGVFLKIKWRIPAKKAKSGEHVHSKNDEWFEVISGTLTYSINGKIATALKGEKIFFPKGIPHQHNNMDTEDLEVIYTCSPALDMERLIESASYLSITSRVKNGNPSRMQSLFWMNDVQAKVYDSTMPIFMQKLLSFLLVPFGRIFGYRRLSG